MTTPEQIDKCFNPRPPCEGRATIMVVATAAPLVVSIRAPPVKGGRHDLTGHQIARLAFQSAPPL